MKIYNYEPKDRDFVLTLDINKIGKAEIIASTGKTPLEALADSLDASLHVWFGVEDSVVVGVGGIALHANEGLGVLWMISDETFMRKNLFTVNALTFDLIDYCFATLGLQCLCNYIDLRNKQSIKWLKSIGFEFMDKPRTLHDPVVTFDEFYLYKSDYYV
jgi:hypothetical protein